MSKFSLPLNWSNPRYACAHTSLGASSLNRSDTHPRNSKRFCISIYVEHSGGVNQNIQSCVGAGSSRPW